MKECVVDADGMVRGGGRVESGDWGEDERMSGFASRYGNFF